MSEILKNQKLTLQFCGLLPLNTALRFPRLPRVLTFLLDNSLLFFSLGNLLHVLIFNMYTLFFMQGFPFDQRVVQIQDFNAISPLLIYLMVFTLKRRQILRTIHRVEEELPTRSQPGIVFIEIDDCVKRCRSLTNAFNGAFVLGTIYHGIQPLVRGHAYEAFPFQMQYPFSWAYHSPCYEILFIVQMIGQVQLGFLFGSYLAFFVSLARILTAQFEMLLCSIRNIPNTALLKVNTIAARHVLRGNLRKWRQNIRLSSDYFEGEEKEEPFLIEAEFDDYNDPFECGAYDKEILTEIKECTRRHSFILNICATVESILSFNMLNTIGALTAIFCLLIFAVTTIDGMTTVKLDIINYLILGYLQLLVMCYYPHIMAHQVRSYFNYIIVYAAIGLRDMFCFICQFSQQ